MFTGIIKALAPVATVTRAADGLRIAVDLGPLASGLSHGDSVCLSGVCLTVAAQRGTICEFDAVAETLSRSTLASIRPGDKLNVEPSLRVGDQLGGHFVMGHADGTGSLATLTRTADSTMIRVTTDPALTAQMVPKGSVAVDGISLTLVGVGPDWFTCAIIPTTLRDTTLALKKPGDKVNIETDILGKFISRYLRNAVSGSPLTLDRLRDAGFA